MDYERLKIALLIAYVAVGLIEWAKAGFAAFSGPKEKWSLPGIVAWGALPVASFVAAAMFDGGWASIIERTGEAWATAQLAYPIIVKLPAEIINSLKAKAS